LFYLPPGSTYARSSGCANRASKSIQSRLAPRPQRACQPGMRKGPSASATSFRETNLARVRLPKDMSSSMKARRASVVISFVFALGVAACHSPTGIRGASDAGQGGSTGDLGTGGFAMGGTIGGGGAGGVPTGGMVMGGVTGGGGSGGVPTGGMVMGGVTGGGGGAVDAGSAGSMCNGLPLPAGAVPVCLPMATMVVCTSCEAPQHPECWTVCINHGCWECGSSGWVLSRVDCVMNCSADAGRDGAGGAISTGGVPAAGGATGTSTMTLAEACTKNCALASGLPTCSTTTTECEQNCMTTYDNTSAINSILGRQYTDMMICIATNFTSSDQFVCAKPNSPLNKWSPGPNSTCEQLICDWNCVDATRGNFDPWLDIRCACSSV
jgi:hypothetical protein